MSVYDNPMFLICILVPQRSFLPLLASIYLDDFRLINLTVKQIK